MVPRIPEMDFYKCHILCVIFTANAQVSTGSTAKPIHGVSCSSLLLSMTKELRIGNFIADSVRGKILNEACSRSCSARNCHTITNIDFLLMQDR
jgi:hypothetical protein